MTPDFLNSIPFDWFITYAKKHSGDVPEFKYVKTYVSNNAGNASFDGIFTGAGKKLADLQKAILSQEEEMTEQYKEDVTREAEAQAAKMVTAQPVMVPEVLDESMSTSDMLHLFVSEYCDILEKKAAEGGKYIVRNANKISTIRESYVYIPGREDYPTQNFLAQVINPDKKMSGERIRQYRESFCLECRDLLVNKQNIDGVVANPILIDRVANLISSIGSTVSLDTFSRICGVKDAKTLHFLVGTLGKKMSDTKYCAIKCVSNYDLQKFDHNIIKVLGIFRREVIGLRLNFEVRAELIRLFNGSPEMIEMFMSFISNSDEFERITDPAMGEMVTLKWVYLNNCASEVCRILYDNKAFDNSSAIRDSNLLKIYNTYAARNGKAKLTSTEQLPSNPNAAKVWRIMTLGRSGYWRLRSSKKEKFVSYDEYARDYVKQNASCSYDSFIDCAKKDGYLRLYSRKTLSDAFIKAGGDKAPKKKVMKNVVRHSDCERKNLTNDIVSYVNSKGVPMTIKDLFAGLSPKYPTWKYGTFSIFVTREVAGRINVKPGTGQRSTVVAPLGVKPEMVLNFRDRIKAEAIKELLLEPSHSLPYSDVKLRYASYVDPGQKSIQAALSKIFGDTAIFIRSKINGIYSLSLTPKFLSANKISVPAPAVTKAFVPGYQWDSLKDTLKKELTIPYREFKFDFDTAADNAFKIMAVGKTTLHSDSPFCDVLNYLPGHYAKQLSIDEENNLKKAILSCLELFIKNFYQVKYGTDVISEIQTYYSGTIGLGTICSHTEIKHFALPYKDKYDNRTIEYVIKTYCQSMVAARNKQLGHIGNSVDKSAHTIEECIHHCLAIFLWLGSKL